MKAKEKVIVLQIRRDRHIRKLVLTERIVEVTDTKYIIVDSTPIELKPEFLLITCGRNDISPVALIDGDLVQLNPERLFPITFPQGV